MVNRKDFRPSNSSYSMTEKDRQEIRAQRERDNYRPHQQKAVGDRDHVIGVFINGNGSSRTSNNSLHTDGRKLYSYNTVIATKQKDGTIVVNNTKYSSTTSTQQNKLLSALKGRGEKYAVTGDKERGYEGEDFSEEIKEEKQASAEYKQLAKEQPENKKVFNELAKDESTHAKELQKLDRTPTGKMTLAEIKMRNRNADQYFFSANTMRAYRGSTYKVKYDKKTDTNWVIVNHKPEGLSSRTVYYKFNDNNGHLDWTDSKDVPF